MDLVVPGLKLALIDNVWLILIRRIAMVRFGWSLCFHEITDFYLVFEKDHIIQDTRHRCPLCNTVTLLMPSMGILQS